MNEQIILDILLALLVFASIIGGLIWNGRIREAKDSEISVKNAQIQWLDKMISPATFEYFEKARNEFERIKMDLEIERDGQIYKIQELEKEISDLKTNRTEKRLLVVEALTKQLAGSMVQLNATNNLLNSTGNAVTFLAKPDFIKYSNTLFSGIKGYREEDKREEDKIEKIT